MSSQKWKELAEKRRLVEQYYKEKDKAIKDYKFRRSVSSDFYERVTKPVTEKIGEQIKKKTGGTGREDDRANAGASIAWTRNTSTACAKKKPTGYIADPDKGIDYHWIPDKYKKVSELIEIKNDADRLHELRKARDMAATEVRNYGYKARAVERRRLQNEETEVEKTLYLNTKENLQKYYKNIEAYNEAERLLTAKPTEGTGFQASRHPYKMTKDGKYGKLTIDVPQLVEKQGNGNIRWTFKTWSYFKRPT